MLVRFRPRLGGRCFSHCIMFGRAIQENPCEQPQALFRCFVRPGRAEYPVWNHLFTFSTGFSTRFVKKQAGFPPGFPLFPPSFPQSFAADFIRSVAVPPLCGKFWGEKRAVFLFSKRKSNPKIYFFLFFAPPRFVLSILE